MTKENANIRQTVTAMHGILSSLGEEGLAAREQLQGLVKDLMDSTVHASLPTDKGRESLKGLKGKIEAARAAIAAVDVPAPDEQDNPAARKGISVDSVSGHLTSVLNEMVADDPSINQRVLSLVSFLARGMEDVMRLPVEERHTALDAIFAEAFDPQEKATKMEDAVSVSRMGPELDEMLRGPGMPTRAAVVRLLAAILPVAKKAIESGDSQALKGIVTHLDKARTSIAKTRKE